MKIRRYVAIATATLAVTLGGLAAPSLASASATTKPVSTSVAAGTTTITVRWTWASAPAGVVSIAEAIAAKSNGWKCGVKDASGECTLIHLSPHTQYLVAVVGASNHHGKLVPIKSACTGKNVETK